MLPRFLANAVQAAPSLQTLYSMQANLAKIAAHNARADATFTLGLNPHADLSTEEFRARYFGAT